MDESERLLTFIGMTILIIIVRHYGKIAYNAYKEVVSNDDNFKCSRLCDNCTDKCKEYGKCSLCENRECNNCIHSLLGSDKDDD